LRQDTIDVQWLGTTQGLEGRLVTEHGFPLQTISVSGLRGKSFIALLRAPYQLIKAFYQAIRIIRQLKPDVILGMGGFVSGPGGLAAWVLRRPLIVHEQNAKAGLTNKLLTRFATRVLEAFPGSFASNHPVITVGNPVRDSLEAMVAPSERFHPHDRLHLLVVGGSLGAKALNELVPEALALLPPSIRPRVIHQTGEKQLEATKARYAQYAVEAEVVPFIRDMTASYSFADVVLCRAGALTVSELCTVGLGAIFIPFPHAVDDHQTANANFMVSHGAALCMQQKDVTPDSLAKTLQGFINAPEQCLQMAMKAYALRQTQVASQIVTICEESVN
jgi:UDP-N-acetylglucosamine--N-acetylmuramyl-(pentapeptide) pyrophosphoryl-undecaprenol N-acetylglucosamine transferase